MADYTLTSNGSEHTLTDIDPDTPLLWVLRDALGLTGTSGLRPPILPLSRERFTLA